MISKEEIEMLKKAGVRELNAETEMDIVKEFERNFKNVNKYLEIAQELTEKKSIEYYLNDFVKFMKSLKNDVDLENTDPLMIQAHIKNFHKKEFNLDEIKEGIKKITTKNVK